MKILHISTNDNTGAGICCLRIHESLLNAGIESKVIVFKNTRHAKEEYQYGYIKGMLSKIPSRVYRMLGFIITDKNRVHRLSQINNNATYSIPLSNVDLIKNKWIQWADIIHLHWVCNYLDYPSFFGSIKKPVVWTFHDEYYFFGIAHYSDQVLVGNELERRYAKIKSEALSHLKDLNIVLLSEYMKKKYSDNTLLKNRRIKVINNSVDCLKFAPHSQQKGRIKYGLNNSDIIIAFMALDICEERKGLALLSSVISSINNSSIKILAIGKNTKNISYSNVISIGPLSTPTEISEALSAADYFAMPSAQEAFAQSPLEAMACGLPVLVFPVSGTSELVNESNGVICSGFSFESLKNGMNILLSRYYDKDKIRQYVIKNYSPQVIANKYIDFYHTIINEQ